MATSLLLMSSSDPTSNTRQPQSDPNPNPNPPRPRGRKSGAKSLNGSKKQPQRGMGVAQLERLLRHQNPPPPPPPPPPQNHHPCFHYDGFAHYGFPVLRGSGQCEISRSGIRVLEGPTTELELPSMPNIHHSDASLSYKKKRVIGDESAVGFMRSEKCGSTDHQINFSSNGHNFPGFDHHHHNHHPVIGGFPAYYYNHGSGSEVVAIHKKGNGSGNVMMEYGFFPGISDENDQKMMENNNNYGNYVNGDLKLKMGLSDSSCSPSSSYSSLSSLTTANNSTTTTTTHLDLSLKLSY